jgi:TPP-dependent pyruvate/acetoin dehydrogenase alpha subunit
MTEHTSLIRDYTYVVRIRMFEERVRELQLGLDIVGSVHLCTGQEARHVGICSLLDPADGLFATYRGHGWALALGVPLRLLFADLLGRTTRGCGGRAGSAYFTAATYGFYRENSIVGAGAPLAVGAALAGQYDASRVAVAVFGDGATNQGAVHEALNFVAAFQPSVLFVGENNHWSEMTPIADVVAEPELWRRARGYGRVSLLAASPPHGTGLGMYAKKPETMAGFCMHAIYESTIGSNVVRAAYA